MDDKEIMEKIRTEIQTECLKWIDKPATSPYLTECRYAIQQVVNDYVNNICSNLSFETNIFNIGEGKYDISLEPLNEFSYNFLCSNVDDYSNNIGWDSTLNKAFVKTQYNIKYED